MYYRPTNGWGAQLPTPQQMIVGLVKQVVVMQPVYARITWGIHQPELYARSSAYMLVIVGQPASGLL